MIYVKSIDKSYIEKELLSYPYRFDVRDEVTSTNTLLKEEAKKVKGSTR